MPLSFEIDSAGRLITAMVSRETQTSRSRSSWMSICHTWLRVPMCTGRAVAVTWEPAATGRRWLALMSWPTQACFAGSMLRFAAKLPTVSASATEAPPCRMPMVCTVRWSTGMVARRKSSPSSVMRMSRYSTIVPRRM